ncbi:MAG: hypothetical protein M3Q95_14420 [Bacteroidota bacterium]|nr:hypothetical protein [Bacteroidota bacterium]
MKSYVNIRCLFTLLCCFIFLSASAQKIVISPATIDESGFGFIKVIGQDEAGYFAVMSNLSLNSESDRVGFKSRKYKIARFGLALDKKWSKPIETTSAEENIDAVTFFNNQVLIVTSLYNKQDNTVRCKFITVDSEGIFNSSRNTLVSFPSIKSSYDKCRVVFSITRQQFALVMREFTNDTSQTAFTAVIDTGFNILTQKSVLVPHPEKRFGFDSFALSVNGDLALLGYHSEKIKALSSKRKIDFYVYASRLDESGFKEYIIPSQKQVSTLGIAFDNFNNQVVLAGFYFEREAKAGTGIFYATIDISKNDNLVFNTKIIEGQNNSSLKRERNLSSGTGLTDYPIERIVIRNDGGVIIVAEAAYTTEYSYYDSFSQSFTQRLEYHFENVVVISVNKDATVDWSAIVEKNQVSLDDDGVFSSFIAILNSEQFLLLYNDDISRRNKILPASITSNGVLTKGKPVPVSDGFILLPRSGKQVAENELLIPAYKKRDLHLVRFTFE